MAHKPDRRPRPPPDPSQPLPRSLPRRKAEGMGSAEQHHGPAHHAEPEGKAYCRSLQRIRNGAAARSALPFPDKPEQPLFVTCRHQPRRAADSAGSLSQEPRPTRTKPLTKTNTAVPSPLSQAAQGRGCMGGGSAINLAGNRSSR